MPRNLDPASRPLPIQVDRRRPRRHRGTNRLRDRIPHIEFLESRIVLSTDTWTGLGTTNLWQDGGNWLGGSAPQANDDLVFPQLTGTTPFVSVNNFASGTTFNSITISGSGYELLGNQADVTGGITASYTSGTSADNINTVLGGGTVTVAAGAELDLGGGITGSAGLTLTGGGTLGMMGATANSYTGTTTVSAGTLMLDKFDPSSGSSTAIPGDLMISGGTVSLETTDQIASTSTVTVSGTNALELNGNDDTIGTLVLDNASLDTGLATLTLTGDLSNDSSSTQVSLAGSLALAAGSHNFDIADPSSPSTPDTIVSAAISGPGGFTKINNGVLELSGAESFAGPLEIASGIVMPTAGASFTGTGGITIDSGGELDLNGVSLSVAIAAAGTGMPVTGGGGAIASTGGANTLSGPITLTADTTVAVDSGTLAVSGAIGDGSPSGGHALTVTGGGTLTLSGVNTYTGATTIADGIVSITSDTPLDSTSGIEIDSGGELDLNGVTLTTPFTSVTGTGAVGGNGGAIVSMGAASTLSGSISLSGAATFDASSGLTISGVIGGTGSLTTAGAQPLSLTNTNTYSGGTTISAGTTLAASAGGALGTNTVTDDGELDLSNSITLSNALTLSSTGNAIVNESGTSGLNGPVTLGLDTTIDVASGSTLNFFDAIGDGSPSNGYGVTETGGGLMVYASTTANTYTGDTTVDSGTLELDEQRGGLAIAGNLNIGDGTDTAEVLDWQNNQIDPAAYVTLNGANASLNLNGLDDAVAVLTFNGGSVTTGAGTLTLARNVFSNGTSPGSTATISGNVLLASNFNHVFSVYSNDAPNGIDLDVSAVITGDATAGINKSGNGTLALDADNATTFAGAVAVQVGTLDVTATGALGTGAVAVDSNPTAVLQLDGSGGDITLSNDITLDSSSNEIVSLAGSNTLSGPITLDASASIDVESGSTLTISGAIGQSGGSFGVTKIADGTMVYAASTANTYSGTTYVNLGELDFNSTAANGAIAGPLVIGTGIFGSGTVEYLASNQVPSTTNVTVNKNSTLNLNGFSDTINDLTVTGGLVSLPAGSSLTAAELTMTGGDINTGTGSTFGLNGDATIDDSAGGLTIDGTGTLVLGGSPSTFTVDTTTPAIGLNISVPIGGAGGLTMTGGGTMEFSAPSANTYTGTTTINDGTLELNSPNTVAEVPGTLIVGDGTDTALVQEENFSQMASTSDITVNANGTLDFNGYDDVIGSMDVNGGSVTVGGAFVSLGGGLTMTGGSITTDSNGNFRIGTGGVTTDASSTTATISGVLDLGNATQTFTIAQGTTSSGVDLDILATIYDGGVSKTGSGTMALDASNTYTGGTTVSAGVLQITNSGALGESGGSETIIADGASVHFSGSGLVVPQDFEIAGSGTAGEGALDLVSGSATLGGAVTMTADASIGAADGTTLTFDGTLDDGGTSRTLTVANAATGRTTLAFTSTTFGSDVDVTAGYLQVGSSVSLGGSSNTTTVAAGATLEVAGGITIPSNNALVVHGSAVAGSDKIVNVSGTNTIDGSITLQNDEYIDVSASSQLNLDGTVGGGSYVIFKDGAGTLELGGTNPLVGAFINSGSLLVNGSSPLSINGAVVYSGATLGGVGTVGNVTVNSGGTVAPGDAPGILNTGDVSFTSGSSYNVELDGTTAGSGYDQLSATGTVDLGDAALGVSLGLGYTPNVGDVYDIVVTQGGGQISGTFDWNGQALSDGSTLTVGNTVFQIAYNGSTGPITLTALYHIDTWTGGDIATSNGWSDGLNWQGGAAPVAGDALVFPTGFAAATNNDFAAGTDFHSITIGDSGYTFTGNDISLDAGITTTSGSGDVTFPLNVALNAGQTFEVDGNSLTLTGTLSGAGALTKTGVGTLALGNGSDDYGGGTTISAGVLQAGGSSSLGSGTVTVNDPASLQLTSGITLNNPLTLNSSSADAVESVSGANTLGGSITLDQAATFSVDSGTLTLGGSIDAGGFAMVASGAGTLLVNGSVSNTGGHAMFVFGTLGGDGTTGDVTVISGGTLQPGSASATAVLSSTGDFSSYSGSTFSVTLGGATPGTQYDQLSVTGTADFNADAGAGATLSVSLAAGYIPVPGTQYTIVSAAAVPNTFNGLPNGSTVTAADSDCSFQINYTGGAVTLTALARTNTWTGGDGNGDWSDPLNWSEGAIETYDALVFPSNTAPTALVDDLSSSMIELTSIEIDAAGLGFTAISGNAITLDNGITTTYGAGATTFAIDTTIAGNEVFSVASGGTLDVSGIISGSGNLLQEGGGTLQLDGTNTYTGGTSVSGVLEVTNDDALGQNGGAGVVVYSELIATNGITLAPTSLTIYGTGVNGAGALVLDDGANANPGTFTIGMDSTIGVTNGSSSIGTAIDDGGSGYGVTIVGGGTLTLTAANTYTGTTDVTAGTLELDDTTGSALAGPLTIDASGGGNVEAEDGAANQLTPATADVTLIGSGATFALNNNNETVQSLTFTGGTVSTGSGTLTLGAGGVTTNAASRTAQITGKLDLDAGTPTFTIAQGTVPGGGPDLSISAVIGDGGLIKAGAGMLSLSGSNTYSGGTTVNDGVLINKNNNTAFGNGTVTINSDGVAMTRGEVEISGASVLYVGNNFVLNSSDAAGDPAIVNTSGISIIEGTVDLEAAATVDVFGSSDLEFEGVVSGAAVLTGTGSGRFILGNNNTYSGGTIADGGQLSSDSQAGAFGTGPVTINNAAQLLIFNESWFTGAPSLGNDITLDTTSSAAIDNENGLATLTGPITLERSATIASESGSTLTIDSVIGDGSPSNGFGMTKTSAGTVILESTSTYTGATTVAAGTLEVDGSIASSSGITVDSGGTLTGSGTVPAVTGDGGAVSPGTTAGTAILSSGGLSLATGSTFKVVLGGTTAGSGYDQLNVTGTVDLDSDSQDGATLNVSFAEGYTPSIGDSFVIIGNNGAGPVQGTFLDQPEGSTITVGSQYFEVTYLGGSGSSVELIDKAAPTIVVNAAPTPSQYAQSVTFSVTVSGSSGTPTGTVTFYDGNPNSGGQVIGTAQPLDGNGDASVSTSSLTAGTHQIYVVYSGDPTYLAGTNTLSGGQLVTQDTTTTTVSSGQPSATYGTSSIFTALVTTTVGLTPTGTVDFFDGTTPIGSVPLNSQGIAALSITTLSVSQSPHSITATYEGDTNDQGSTSGSYSQTIIAAPLTITANSTSKTYGQTLTFAGTEFTTSGLVNGDTVTLVSLTSAGAAATAGVAGSPYAITASDALGSGLDNYTITYVSGQLTVNTAALTITADSTTKTYGDTVIFDGTEFSTTGLVNSDSVDSVSLSSLGADPTAIVAGSPYAIAASDAVGSGLDNYTISYVPGQLTVNTAALTITADSTSKTYGDTVTFDGTEFSTTGLVNSDSVDSVSLSSLGADPTAAVAGSPYAITASDAVGSGLDNYTISYVPGQLTVNTAALTITADSTTKMYGDTVTFDGTEFSTTGLVNDDSVDSVSLSSLGADPTAIVAGSPYAITASNAVGPGLDNYTITYVPGQLTVNTAALTITADSTTKTYGDTVIFDGTEFSTTGLVNSDSVDSVSLSSLGADPTATVAGSPYAITASNAVGSGLDNYTITYVPGQLTVNTAALTITADSTTKTYGDTVTFDGTEFSTTGLVNDDSVDSVSLSSLGAAPTAGVAGSPYDIDASDAVGSGLDNYTISYVPGQLTVNAAALTITAASTSKTYGQAVTFDGTEFTTDGLVNGDTVSSVSLSSLGAAATAGVAGSPYDISASNAVGTGLGNYTISYVPGQLTVNAAALTITADSTSKTYGQTVTFDGTEFSTAGLVNGDTVSSVSLSSPGAAATAGVAGSPYDISASNAAGTGLGNYAISYVPGQLTVNTAALTITADSTTKTYGQTVTFDGTEFSTAGLVNGDTVSSVNLSSLGAAATAGVAGSPYAIAASSAAGTGLGNYTISYVPGHLVVTPAALTITADNQARVFGAPNPTFTATYSGFVNGETPASLTTPVILSTTAATDSPVGAYPIVASNATSANYAITFRDGTLAVARASSSTTMATPSAASVFGQAVTFTVQVGPGPNLATGSVNFLVDGIMAASVPVDSITGLATWTTTALGLGSHTISVAYTGNTDVLPSLSGSIQQAVSQANSQSGLGSHVVRNRRGQIVAVDLDASVLAGSPGSGIPDGTVTFFQGQRKLGKATLSGGTAELTVKPGLVLGKAVKVQYAGNADFLSSVSPKVTITRKSITAVARPFAAFYTRSHAMIAKSARPMVRHASHGRGH